MDNIELEARVCRLFCEGKSVAEIVAAAALSGIKLNRQGPHEIVRSAAKRGRIQYVPPTDLIKAEEIRKHRDWLRIINVVHSIEATDVANAAANNLLDLIAKPGSGEHPEGEFHLGFAGGGLLEMTARLLAEKIRRTTTRLPKRLYLHAMVAQFGDEPATDPNSFLGHFTSQPLPVETRFIGLPAPGFVSVETIRQLRSTEGIQPAFERVKELDAIITSAGGHWSSGCSYLHRLYEEGKHADLLKEFRDAGVAGDLMWRPIGGRGPVELRHGVRATTLVDLNELPGLITAKKRVFLVLALCGTCRRPKDELLDAVLTRDGYITDLVIDSMTAEAVLRRLRR